MCDYSLMTLHNRLAMEGEDLVAHRFATGTTGFVSTVDLAGWRARRPERFWQRLKECFATPVEPGPVVCIPPGARLRVQDIPQRLRNQFGLGACETATFTQTSADASRHRDALVFANESTVLLQLLAEGQMVTVLRLSSEESAEPREAVPIRAA